MKGRVCVTGGTGFLGSWMVKRLLQDGYFVNTTIRIDSEGKRDISYLTNLPGASERLQIFHADLDRPGSFAAAIEGCVGVFHLAHSMAIDFQDEETDEIELRRAIDGMKGILQACIDSKTVKRVVHTSSMISAGMNEKAIGSPELIDENSWTDVEFVKRLRLSGGSYMVTKTLAERTALDFAEKHGLDVVTVLPSCIHGPFICPKCPDTVHMSMALIFGDEKYYQSLMRMSLVHVDDVARAHIHLFEYANAKGRYICSGINTTINQLHRLISDKYPQYQIPNPDSWKDLQTFGFPFFSSQKLLETGFKYENGLEDMFDGATKSCKEMGLL